MPNDLADALAADAAGAGVPLSDIVRTDLARYRTLAAAAVPALDKWEWSLLSHALSGIEAHHILADDDSLPSPASIAIEIDTWADGAQDDDCLRAGDLRQRVLTWTPLMIAGVLLRLRRL